MSKDESRTYASAEENLGGYIPNEELGKMESVPNAADAQVDLKRGVVITTTKVLEPGDYAFYYNNIKQNVATRIAAYKKMAKQ